ncbi:MAG TPA: aminopeptidase P family protein [Stellaceae bacterium]|jgi:Xaa-Pro aminopeptidase|nr:aminopeptidase P family protein [Stellaceae bacterium]
MNTDKATPDRDELARLLRAAGSAYDPAGVEALIAGVLGAPAEIGTSWHNLVADPVPPALEEALEKLRVQMAAGYRDGLAREDFARLSRADRTARLRRELAARGLDGFIVPRSDEHQGEYVPPRGQRLAWLTGFTGSAGLAVVLRERAALFVDGRYTLQAAQQADGNLFEIHHLIDEPPARWIGAALKPGAVLGYDPWLHTPHEVERFATTAEKAGASLCPVDGNPLDRVWTDQPAAPLAPVVPHADGFAGESAQSKRERLARGLAEDGVAAVVLTMPESVAWLLNIRGGDVPHTPLPLSFAILRDDASVCLFVDRRKLAPGLERHLGNAVTVSPSEQLGPALDALAAQSAGQSGGRVQADPASAAAWIFDRLEAAGAKIHRAADPCVLPKACKNAAEVAGTRAAHRRDGAALTRFLAWLAREAPQGDLSEIAASDRLEAFRRDGEYFRDLSFPTISGAGSNGAIVHYRAMPETEKHLEPGSLYLLDSGAQYLDGTTDVTRTVAIGEPTAEMRDRFTRVLKGHIALALARFPKGTTGTQLDAFARRGLWQAGLDYDHGTGHGVGSYLGVHEGPQRISKAPSAQPLLPGMIISNEPGYYKTGAYGIRIENLVLVQHAEANGGEREMMCFETLTLAPIDRNLVEPSLLDDEEINWLDTYHAEVRATLTPLVDPDTGQWLAAATEPIRRLPHPAAVQTVTFSAETERRPG